LYQKVWMSASEEPPLVCKISATFLPPDCERLVWTTALLKIFDQFYAQ